MIIAIIIMINIIIQVRPGIMFVEWSYTKVEREGKKVMGNDPLILSRMNAEMFNGYDDDDDDALN